MANKPGFDTDTGRGGETHQRVPKRGPHGAEGHLTTNQGIRVSDNQNSLKAGVRGPTGRAVETNDGPQSTPLR
jgi:catalase